MRNPFLRTRICKRLKFQGDVVFFIKKKHKSLFTHSVPVTVTVTVNLLTLCQWKQTVFLQNGFCTHLVRKRSISIDTRLKFDGDGDGHGMCKQTLRSIHTEWHRHRNIDGQHLWSLTETVTGRMGCIPIFARQRNGVVWCERAFKQHSYVPLSGQDSCVLCPLGVAVASLLFIRVLVACWWAECYLYFVHLHICYYCYWHGDVITHFQ